MEHSIKRPVIAVLLLFSGAFLAFAQKTIAVHPVSSDSNARMAGIFFEELVKAIPAVPGFEGAYKAYSIDIVNNLPDDVPPGGFPSYVCPSPSLTKGAAYAITADLSEDKEFPGDFWMRMYLWEMSGSRLLVSDMVNASDRESCAASYPYILNFLFSMIEKDKEGGGGGGGEQENNWLLLGIRVGAGNSTWHLNESEDYYNPDFRKENFLNLSVAFQAVVNLFPWLAVQVEVNLNGYYDIPDSSEDSGGIGSECQLWHVTTPIFVKFNLQRGPLRAGLYLGPWWHFPLSGMGKGDAGISYMRQPLGLSLGITAGVALGPGRLFLDARSNHLFYFSNDGSETKYPFNGSTFSVGYEFGLIAKKK